MTKKNWKFRLGLILMIISVPMFLALPVIPFLELDGKTKVAASTVLLVMGEVLFWSGGLLVGKELVVKYKARLNPKNWFRRKPEDKQEEL